MASTTSAVHDRDGTLCAVNCWGRPDEVDAAMRWAGGTVVPLHQDVTVPVYGEDGTVYALFGRVGHAVNRAGYRRAAAQFYQRALQCPTYDAVLDLARRTVEIA